MNRVPPESSVLASVLYLPQLRLLEVEFHSGLFYQYFDVPQHSYTALLTAESKGAYFNANIRNRFSSKQINRPSSTGHAAV
jgi:KTSC domain